MSIPKSSKHRSRDDDYLSRIVNVEADGLKGFPNIAAITLLKSTFATCGKIKGYNSKFDHRQMLFETKEGARKARESLAMGNLWLNGKPVTAWKLEKPVSRRGSSNSKDTRTAKSTRGPPLWFDERLGVPEWAQPYGHEEPSQTPTNPYHIFGVGQDTPDYDVSKALLMIDEAWEGLSEDMEDFPPRDIDIIRRRAWFLLATVRKAWRQIYPNAPVPPCVIWAGSQVNRLERGLRDLVHLRPWVTTDPQ